MFFTASGSTLEIGSARPDWRARPVTGADFDGEIWVSVAGLSGLGRISGEWQTESSGFPDWRNPEEPQIPTIEKVARPLQSMQVVAGIVADDEGQELMLAAESSIEAFAFKISTPDGALRRFIALVISADHVFDEANAVLSWSFSLSLQSNIYRGEG